MMLIIIIVALFASCRVFQGNRPPRGVYGREVLSDTVSYPWYAENYDDYTPNPAWVDTLAANLTPKHEILVFGGTWCGDTKNLLPKFYRVMDALPSPPKITLVLVDRKKKSGKKAEKPYNIEFVPTFIVLKDGKEEGRIVESVQTSIEKDLALIVSGE